MISGLDGRRGGVPAARPRCAVERPGRRACGASRAPVMAVGAARGAPDRRAHGAELPRAAVRHRDADRAACVARVRGPAGARDPRHAQDHAGAARLEKAAVAGRRRRQPPRRPLRRDPDQGEPRRARRRRRRGGAARARGAAGLPVEVECATSAEVDEALAAGAPRLLLDNMTPDEVRRRGRAGGRPRGARGVAAA